MSPADPPRLAQSLFDRVAHHRRDGPWLTDAWSRAQVLLVSARSTTPAHWVSGGARVDLVPSTEVPADAQRLFLGERAGTPYFAVVVDDPGEWLGLRDLGPTGEEFELDLLVTAVALVQWHRRHPRCPQCGAETVVSDAGWTRRCVVDNSQHFPRTDPAVIMLVHDGAGRCLLGRGASWGAGRFSTLAGFVEPGESLEAAVAREVFEEVAVRVHDVTYVASQPWPFPASLMLGFAARADSSAPLQADLDEMAEAAWFSRDEVRSAASWTDAPDSPTARSVGGTAEPGSLLQSISPKLSISRYLIDRWLANDLPG